MFYLFISTRGSLLPVLEPNLIYLSHSSMTVDTNNFYLIGCWHHIRSTFRINRAYEVQIRLCSCEILCPTQLVFDLGYASALPQDRHVVKLQTPKRSKFVCATIRFVTMFSSLVSPRTYINLPLSFFCCHM